MFTIPRLSIPDRQMLQSVMETLQPEPIACCNWPDAYPYAPQVFFRAAHDGENLYLAFEVREQVTRALEVVDGCKVCTDSCVELFLQPDAADAHYYNFEFNAAGTLYAACRTGRPNPERFTPELMQLIGRQASLTGAPIEEFVGQNHWQLLVTIPAKVLFRHEVSSWSGRRMRMNLYKCGDALSRPHYLSWAPIPTPQPDFHRPEYFAEVAFA